MDIFYRGLLAPNILNHNILVFWRRPTLGSMDSAGTPL